jgi:hypothetical protein
MTRFGVSDLMEDIRFTGAFRTPTNFDDFEWLMGFTNFRRRIDWGGTYYRKTEKLSTNTGEVIKNYSNLYQLNIAYPFAETKAIRMNIGLRFDKDVYKALDPVTTLRKDSLTKVGLVHLEYVQDYTLNPTMNIWNGLRWKIYIDGNTQINKNIDGKFTYNFGGDARYYLPIYRHITWASRAAADFSWGNRKVIYYLGGIDQNLQI